jgi:uncharacterized protein
MKLRWVGLLFGAAFGFLLSWAHLTDYDVIHDMLLLRRPDVFMLMGSAMAVGFVGVHLLRALGARTALDGTPVSWTRSRPTRNHIVGSILFGVGWSIACTCTGPAAAQLGRGQLVALFTVTGLVVGVALRGWVQRRRAASVAAESKAVVAGL